MSSIVLGGSGSLLLGRQRDPTGCCVVRGRLPFPWLDENSCKGMEDSLFKDKIISIGDGAMLSLAGSCQFCTHDIFYCREMHRGPIPDC